MPTGHREVETKYDVADDSALPTVADLPDVARVEGPHTFLLEAHYFDTDDLALAGRGITLRRRTGGEDEGWHLKLPVSGAREEIHAALGRSTRTPPLALRRVVQGVARDRPLAPVATVVTERTMASLVDADESVLVEICDDRVVATRTGAVGDEEHSWREWEVEVHAARPRLLKALRTRLRKQGAHVATGSSKFGRLMQIDADAPSHDHPGVPTRTTEHELLARHIASLTDDLHRLDPLARADLPDALHQLRLVFRRLRAALTAFEASFDTTVTDPIRDELRWIGDILGRPRDLEVLQSQLGAVVLSQPTRLVRGRPGPWIDRRLRAARRSAHKQVLEAMATERYFSLVDSLDSWQAGPPWSARRDRRASKGLPKVLHHEWKRVERAVAKADAADDTERPELLHQVRIAAKRARYAAEVLRPVLGTEARDIAKAAKKIQNSLGAHHDTLVAVDQVFLLADAARDEGRDTFTFGVLAIRLEAALAEHEGTFRRTWKRVRP
jgi:CHAD domain-containing protein